MEQQERSERPVHGARPVSLDTTRGLQMTPRSATESAPAQMRKPAAREPDATAMNLPAGQQYVVTGIHGGIGTTTVSLALAGLLARDHSGVLWTETASTALPRSTRFLGVTGKGTLAAAAHRYLRGENPALESERNSAGLLALVGSQRGEYAPPDSMITKVLASVLPQYRAAVVDAGVGPRIVATDEHPRVPNVVTAVPPAVSPSAVWVVVCGSKRSELEHAAEALEVLGESTVRLREQAVLVINETAAPDRGGRAARVALSARTAAVVTLPRSRELATDPTNPAKWRRGALRALSQVALVADQGSNTPKPQQQPQKEGQS